MSRTGSGDGMDDTVTSTTASDAGNEADSTTMGSATTADSTGLVLDSTGDCEVLALVIEPFADTFVGTGDGPCASLDCQTLDSGGSPQGLVESVNANFQSYMLLSFNLPEAVPLQRPASAKLTLTIGHGSDVQVEVSQVFPTSWTEGDGLGSESAGPGEAAWLWSSNPAPWSTTRGSGTFELVLAGAVEMGSAGVPFVVGSHPVSIDLDSAELDGWIDSEIVHLLVKKVAGAEELIAFTRESTTPPHLTITGC